MRVTQFSQPAAPVAGDPDDEAWAAAAGAGSGSDSDSSDQAPLPPACLADVQARVDEAIRELGGRVHPKLTWSCPMDAVFLSPTNTLACDNADEVFLLLRASDRVAHDVCAALPAQSSGPGAEAGVRCPAPHAVVLRRWHDLRPGREFRGFVVHGALAGTDWGRGHWAWGVGMHQSEACKRGKGKRRPSEGLEGRLAGAPMPPSALVQSPVGPATPPIPPFPRLPTRRGEPTRLDPGVC